MDKGCRAVGPARRNMDTEESGAQAMSRQYREIGSHEKGAYCQTIQRAIWQGAFGPIAPGFVIHHRNGDIEDNSLENLQLMSLIEHGRLHGLQVPHGPRSHRPPVPCWVCGGGPLKGNGLCRKCYEHKRHLTRRTAPDYRARRAAWDKTAWQRRKVREQTRSS